MESGYINTAHPDFLNGHRAIAIVNDRINQKNNPQQNDSQGTGNNNRKSHTPASSLQTNMLPDATTEKENGSLFGSFFNKNKNSNSSTTSNINGTVQKKSAAAIMDVPPTTLKATGALSDREYMETEVISKFFSPSIILLYIRD